MALAGSLTYATDLDTKGFEKGLDKVGSIAKGVAVGVGAATVAVGVAIGNVVKQAVQNYADYEQLVGGVETLFKSSADKVQEYASQAYKTAGLSANQYMETVTSFSASLLQSLGGDTKKAAEYSNRAVIDMSDNANKMGTDMGLIQSAYQGFAKQNYTMLDNLKLGYGGTKTEMERLIKDASKMKDVQKELGVTVDANSISFGNIVNAISVMQQSMGIAGTTAKEAEQTISGSLNMMKSSWSNLITGIADENADFDKLMNDFVTSVEVVFENLFPRIMVSLDGVGNLIPALAENILSHLPELMDAGIKIIDGLMNAIVNSLPTILEAGTNILQALLNGIIKYIPKMMPTVVQVILNLVKFIIDNLPKIIDTGIKILLELVNGIVQAIPELIPACVKAIGQIVDTLLDNLDEIIIAALDIIIALALGLVAALPELVAKIPTIIEKLTRALTDPAMLAKLIEAALQLIIALATGLITAIPVLLGKLPIIIVSIATGLARSIIETDWGKLGRNILDGILNGLTNAGNAIKNAAKKLFKSIKDNIASLFGIHSPSTVMRDEIGKNLILGIGVSFDKDADMIDKDIKEFSDEIIDKMQDAVNLQTGAMAFSGTAGSVTDILSANTAIQNNINLVTELDGEKVYENQQVVKARKELQYGGVR